jgi:hypothetical protein
VTRLVKTGGPLTKKLHLTAHGALANDSSQCRMSKGLVERVRLDQWRDFAPLIEATPYNTAWALGSLRDCFPDGVRLVVKNDPQAGKPGFIARTAENFAYRPGPAFVLLDCDAKGMPDTVRARVEALGGFVGALAVVCPEFADAGYIRRRSTSAGVINGETGAEYASSGEHVFVVVADGPDARRFLCALHDRTWIGGFGWQIVGKAGQLLERSIVDRMVCAPERLVFEAAPELDPPLEQRPRHASVHDGPPLDTQAACPDLKPHEKAELQRLKTAAAHARKPQAEAAKAAFLSERLAGLVERGMPPNRARATVESWSKGVLRPGAVLDFDDKEIGAGHVRLRYTTTYRGEKRASDYSIALVTTPQPFGGRRWWFRCPKSGDLVGKLHMPDDADTFASQRAHRLGYSSQRETRRAPVLPLALSNFESAWAEREQSAAAFPSRSGCDGAPMLARSLSRDS